MTAANLEAKVRDFLAQTRVAVVGLSQDPAKPRVADAIYKRLKRDGREMIPVHPRLETFDGDRCFPDLPSVPGGVGAVMIVTRPQVTEQIVRDCRAAGVTRVWMHQSMGAAGSSVSPAAVDDCRAHGIEVIAGACPMMYVADADFGHKCMRWMLGLSGGLPS